MRRSELKWMGSRDRFARLRRIERLTLRDDYREIVQLFYADFQSVMLSKSFNGLMFTYAAPHISRTLSATGELERRIAKRIVDTTLLASAVMEHGFDEGKGLAAAHRVRTMHSRYAIRKQDFIATGCEEVLGSLEIAERYGWRPVTTKEAEALRLFYSEQARAFGSPEPLPGSIAEVKVYFSHYLDTQLRFEPQNERLAKVLIDWIGGLAPPALAPLFRAMFVADLDPRIARACGLKVASAPTRWAAQAALRHMGRKDPVPDGLPNGFEDLVSSVYPNGWEIERLGTHVAPRETVREASLTRVMAT